MNRPTPSPPSISRTAFDCPHCGAFTTQHWHTAHLSRVSNERKLPLWPRDDYKEFLLSGEAGIDKEQAAILTGRFSKIRSNQLFADNENEYANRRALNNLHASQCFNCERWAIWVGELLVYPQQKFGSLPNIDLPEEVFGVVEEARGIISSSPRGAAAMLRLAIQMLCIALGESGKNLNSDISSLVKQGLNPVIQKSLDVVRVIGNESVHPGEINLNDDRETAERLFDLINIIAEQMITQPKHVEELFEKLPQAKKDAIARRDKVE